VISTQLSPPQPFTVIRLPWNCPSLLSAPPQMLGVVICHQLLSSSPCFFLHTQSCDRWRPHCRPLLPPTVNCCPQVVLSPAATCLYLFQRWLVFESFAKQRQQQPHHQLTDDSTNVTTFQVQRTWTYFTYLQYFCRAEATSGSSFPMKTEQVFGHSLAICTVVNIDSQGTRNGESPYSPNLKSDFPEFLGNSWGIPGECTT